MKPNAVRAAIGNIPYMGVDMGEIVHRHITMFGLKRVLELGHAHGSSTCFFAGAAQDIGGDVVSIDLEHTANLLPRVEDLLEKCQLKELVTIYRQKWIEGGEWRLLQLIKAGRKFDFAYIDAAHTWTNVAANFIMVDALLEKGGWILFDDIAWSVDIAQNRQSEWCKSWTEEMKAEYQVRNVWQYLVKPHPSYGNFCEPIPNWGLCQKVR